MQECFVCLGWFVFTWRKLVFCQQKQIDEFLTLGIKNKYVISCDLASRLLWPYTRGKKTPPAQLCPWYEGTAVPSFVFLAVLQAQSPQLQPRLISPTPGSALSSFRALPDLLPEALSLPFEEFWLKRRGSALFLGLCYPGNPATCAAASQYPCKEFPMQKDLHQCCLPHWLDVLQKLGLIAKMRLVLDRFVSEKGRKG